MLEGSKYCSNVKKIYFSKELVMIKKDDKDFEISTKCWVLSQEHIQTLHKDVVILTLK